MTDTLNEIKDEIEGLYGTRLTALPIPDGLLIVFHDAKTKGIERSEIVVEMNYFVIRYHFQDDPATYSRRYPSKGDVMAEVDNILNNELQDMIQEEDPSGTNIFGYKKTLPV